MQEPEEPFVLASVSVVCRRWPSVEDLPHAVHLIHTFTAEISKKALPDLLEHGDSSLFFRVLQAVDESVNLIHHEKLRQYRLAMQLIPSKMTLKGGKLQAMKELYKRYRGAVDDDTVRAVAAEPELPVLKWLHSCEPRIFKNFTGFEERIFRFASTNDRKGVVRWLVKLFPDTVRSLEFAAGGGHLDLIKWLMKHTKWDTEVMKFLAANYSFNWSEKAMANAQMHGHTETVKWLYFHLGMKLLPHEVNAARNDFIDLLELMDKETDFCRNPTVFFAGCGNNHPEVAEWYKDHYGNPRKRKHCSQ
ncbi:hypothetical protein PF005_g17731 [Phytophthora fragariae]|uniref:Uncharacterized protein n=1 Tax=Phytophthora fragariae TaxID=53985 RepID=A0A6A4CSY1_9STRA|nr:hypothetical protein PF005_g17731 [Phytophthora fragariae]KAE9296028.1 hypothetical protein PF001_g17054 [Phytophthora fragariae]